MNQWKIITHPMGLMDEINSRPTLALPLLTNGALFLMAIVLSWALLGEALFALAGETLDTANSAALNNYRIQSAVSTFALWMLSPLVKAVFVNLQLPLHQVQRDYRRVLSVILHGVLILALGELVYVPLRYLTRDPQFTLSIGQFIKGLPTRFGAVLTYFDIFNILFQTVVILGISRVTGLSRQKSALVVLVPVVLMLALIYSGQ